MAAGQTVTTEIPLLLCPGCRRPLAPSKDLYALREAGRVSELRFECMTPECQEFGRRRSAAAWQAGGRHERPTWDEVAIDLAFSVARRGTCDRSQVGCVLTVNNRTIATGYNGAVAGAPHCDDVGHLMEGASCVRTVHAEANAIADCARRGVATEGSTAYVTRIPCVACALLLVSAGVVRVVAAVRYRDPETVRWVFEAARVPLEWPGGALGGLPGR